MLAMDEVHALHGATGDGCHDPRYADAISLEFAFESINRH